MVKLLGQDKTYKKAYAILVFSPAQLQKSGSFPTKIRQFLLKIKGTPITSRLNSS